MQPKVDSCFHFVIQNIVKKNRLCQQRSEFSLYKYEGRKDLSSETYHIDSQCLKTVGTFLKERGGKEEPKCAFGEGVEQIGGKNQNFQHYKKNFPV